MARKLTLKELDQEIAKLQEQKAAIWTSEKAEVIARMKDAVTYYGITAEDLGLGGARSKKPRQSAMAQKPARAGAGRVKFRDDAGHTWSGFGRKPKWYVEALAAGKSDAELRA